MLEKAMKKLTTSLTLLSSIFILGTVLAEDSANTNVQIESKTGDIDISATENSSVGIGDAEAGDSDTQ